MSSSAIFFSRRCRHTSYWRDWSSDVCSSDLSALRRTFTLSRETFGISRVPEHPERLAGQGKRPPQRGALAEDDGKTRAEPARSEERRVGNNCRHRVQEELYGGTVRVTETTHH